MKATLSFSLPDERDDLNAALKAQDTLDAIDRLDCELRAAFKHRQQYFVSIPTLREALANIMNGEEIEDGFELEYAELAESDDNETPCCERQGKDEPREVVAFSPRPVPPRADTNDGGTSMHEHAQHEKGAGEVLSAGATDETQGVGN